MSKKYNVAVVGATGNVGREMLAILAERDFPVDNVVALASARSVNQEVSFGLDKILKCQDLDKFDFSNTDIAFFSPGGSVSAKYAPIAAKQGCVVIDNTSHFRMQDGIPLVAPEVNPEALENFRDNNIIANPNCSTIQMVVALKPLHEAYGVKRVNVSTYQSVSGAGKAAMDELYGQTKAIYAAQEVPAEQFTKRIAFNVIPHIDVFVEGGDYDGFTKEEWKMMVETKKIMGDSIDVNATCVRCPVFVGHAESVHVELEKPFELADVQEALGNFEGLLLVDRRDDGGYATPAESAGEDAVMISRVRRDPTTPNGLNMWVVADNMRKGAALNAVQIAEVLIERYGL